MNPGQCHYAWVTRGGAGSWTRCVRRKGVTHGERHENGQGSWVAVAYELDYPRHRWEA